MKYHILKFDTVGNKYAHNYVNGLFDIHPNLSYSQALEIYKVSNIWNSHIEELMEFGAEGTTCVADCPFLQKKWLEEHGYNPNISWLETIITQIKHYSPDVIFLQEIFSYNKEIRDYLRKSSNKPVKIIGWRSAHTNNYIDYVDLDLVLTSNRIILNKFKEKKVNAILLPHGFNPNYLNNSSQDKPQIDFSFIGGCFLPDFSIRAQYLMQLLKKTPLEIYGDYYECTSIIREYPYILNRSIKKRDYLFLLQIDQIFNYFINRYRFTDKIHPSVWGINYYKILGDSKITFNCHVNAANNYSGNMRLFEATGMGATLLTEWTPDITNYFTPGEEIICYSGVRDCVQKAQYLLAEPDYCKEIGKNGQNRTLREHTIQCRMKTLHQIILNMLE